jgi:SAM-dependent methyltransferase
MLNPYQVKRMKAKEADNVNDPRLTPPYARAFVKLVRPFADFDLFFVKSLRRTAVQKLQLRPGNRVLDIGCGPGGSFPFLVDAVTSSGTVVGVEISPEMAINARKRVEKNGWTNVQVIVANAGEVELQGSFDGLLLLGTPDIYASPEVLCTLVPSLKSDARVVAFGARLSRRPLGSTFNSLFRSTFSKLTFTSTPALDYEPWKALQGHFEPLQVEELFFGWMFLAWGQRTAGAASGSPPTTTIEPPRS